jgi:hypothetical protein
MVALAESKETIVAVRRIARFGIDSTIRTLVRYCSPPWTPAYAVINVQLLCKNESNLEPLSKGSKPNQKER